MRMKKKNDNLFFAIHFKKSVRLLWYADVSSLDGSSPDGSPLDGSSLRMVHHWTVHHWTVHHYGRFITKQFITVDGSSLWRHHCGDRIHKYKWSIGTDFVVAVVATAPTVKNL